MFQIVVTMNFSNSPTKLPKSTHTQGFDGGDGSRNMEVNQATS